MHEKATVLQTTPQYPEIYEITMKVGAQEPKFTGAMLPGTTPSYSCPQSHLKGRYPHCGEWEIAM